MTPPRMSAHAARARALLLGGVVGAHAVAALLTVALGLTVGWAVGVSCLVAAAAALAFFVVGQAVQVIMADADPTRVLLAALASYGTRVGVFGGLLALSIDRPWLVARLDPTGIAAGAIAVAIGWVAGEVVAYTRLRIPIYDEPQA